jgi:hypothetical protein
MASAKNLDELRERYREWCLARLAEDRLDCCRVPAVFHVLCEVDDENKHKRAIVKFNGGRGALLCNRCRTIIRSGTDHEDIEHYCAECHHA